MHIFLNLSPSEIPLLLPTPSFSIGDQLKFIHKYTSFMVSNKIVSIIYGKTNKIIVQIQKSVFIANFIYDLT